MTRAGMATDAGRLRAENQDRHYVDEFRGIFLVVDGLGGHAAGGKAAETAVEVIRAELENRDGDPRQFIRRAITNANNTIYQLAAANEHWSGMACVMTLAVVSDGRATIGHVGDSRLYLVWNGTMRKLTPDHSPVGEREDRGELMEQEAMAHPRRHEIFRDVGSKPHEPEDDEFVEIREFLFKPDAAVLLCTDGLSDVLTSAQMSEIIERYDGDAPEVARNLVRAANEAGGNDNITAVFVAGPEFAGRDSPSMAEARERHAITRVREAPASPEPLAARVFAGRLAFLLYGVILGILLMWVAGNRI